MQETPISLSQLKVGEEGVVCRIAADTDTRWRLLDLGLVKGTLVKVVRRSPLGDPVLYVFRETAMALRGADSQLILIRRIV